MIKNDPLYSEVNAAEKLPILVMHGKSAQSKRFIMLERN